MFNICIITASNKLQAGIFRQLLSKRIESELYPKDITFLVYSDPEKGRVGSGGGTLWALHKLLAEFRIKNPSNFFASNRILIIHAGGESRRLPCYVPEGKLFAPVPATTSMLIPPTVIDLQLSLFLKYPWKSGELIVASGDAVIDFNASLTPLDRGDICGFAKSASFDQGSRHGVFKFDRKTGKVLNFYQKQSASFLQKNGAIEGRSECALDMGIVSFSPPAACTLVNLGGKLFENRLSIIEAIGQGALKIDLYLEVLSASIANQSFASYIKKIGKDSKAPLEVLKMIYDEFSQYPLHGVLTEATSFLHFGSLSELYDSSVQMHHRDIRPFYVLDHEEIEPEFSEGRAKVQCINTSIRSSNQARIYAEGCSNSQITEALGENVFIGLKNFSLAVTVPRRICIDERNLTQGTTRMVYGIFDSFKPELNFKTVRYMDQPMGTWLIARGLLPEDIWDDTSIKYDLYTAKLFCMALPDEFCSWYWSASPKESDSLIFKKTKRYSLAQINSLDSSANRDENRAQIRAQILRLRVENGSGWHSIPASDFKKVFSDPKWKEPLKKICAKTDDSLLSMYRETLLKEICHDTSVNKEIRISFVQMKDRIKNPAVKEDQIVWARSPVRLDLAGGWSDTPPYTMRFGGKVVNVAVDLNGQPPIQVFCRPSKEYSVTFTSIDLGIRQTITTFEELESFNNPTAPFCLPRAALTLMGISRTISGNNSMTAVLKQMGCGIEISLLSAIPKGSGLGTSSILGATILAALNRFFGRAVSMQDLFRQVLELEQMLTTGGGWQDQIGGVVGGVKYIESKPGLKPDPVIHQLDEHLFADSKYHECFTLFYTGITRLAKNILADVVTRVNQSSRSYLYLHTRLKELAQTAREVISLRDIKGLSDVLNTSWDLNKQIHPSTSNVAVERLLIETQNHYTGVKLLGAGGGGYCLFLSQSAHDASMLKNILHEKYEDNRARIVDFSLNPVGLQVTVS